MVDRPEACAEWQEDLAAWLVAQIPPHREEALLDHLAGCATCRAEADSLLGVAAITLAVEPTPSRTEVVGGDDGPSPDLGDRIVARLRAERRGQRTLRLAGAALAAAAVVVVAFVAVRDGGDGSPLEGDDVEFVQAPPGVAAAAVVATEVGGGALVELVATGLDPATTYALWLSPPGGGWDDRVPAGTFRPDEDGDVDVRLHSALAAEDTGRVWATTAEGEIALDTE